MSKRSSPSRPPTCGTSASSSSRSGRNVDCSVSSGPKSSSSTSSHSRAERRARLLGERRRVLRRAALGVRGVGEHEALARARHRDVQQAPHLGDVLLARVAAGASAGSLGEHAVGDRLDARRRGAGHPRGLQAAARRRGRTPGPWPRASAAPATASSRGRLSPSSSGSRRPAPRRRRRASGRTRAPWPAARGARRPRPARRSGRG